MLKYDNTVSSTATGQPIYGAQVAVYEVDANNNNGAQAAIYADEAGTMPLSQPILTDQAGYFAFYIGDGKYNITVMTGTVEISRTNITMVDSLQLKQRALLVPVNEDSGTLPPAGARAGMLLGFDPADGSPTALAPNSFPGPAGPADNTYTPETGGLTAFKASDVGRGKASLLRLPGVADGDVYWKPGDTTPDDGQNYFSSTFPGANGRWVRQTAEGVAYQAPRSAYIINSQLKLRQVVSVEDFGAQAGGASHDDTGAFADILATGRTAYVPTPTDTAGNILAYGVANIPATSGKEIRGEKRGMGAGTRLIVGQDGAAAFRDTTNDTTTELKISNLFVLGAPGVRDARFLDKTDLTKYLAYAHIDNVEIHRNLRYGVRGCLIFLNFIDSRSGYIDLGQDNLVNLDSSHTAIQSLPNAWNQGNEPNINTVKNSHFFGAFGNEAALDFRYGHQLKIEGCDFENISNSGLACFGVGMVEVSSCWAEAVNHPDGIFRIMGYPNAVGSGSYLHLHDSTFRMIGASSNLVYIEPTSPSRLDVENVGVFFCDATRRLTNAPGLVGINRNVRAYTYQDQNSPAQPNFQSGMHREAVLTGGRQLMNGALDNAMPNMPFQVGGGITASGGLLSRDNIAVGQSPVLIASSVTGLGGTAVVFGYDPMGGGQFRVIRSWQGAGTQAIGNDSNGTGKSLNFTVSGGDLYLSVNSGSLVVFTTHLQ